MMDPSSLCRRHFIDYLTQSAPQKYRTCEALCWYSDKLNGKPTLCPLCPPNVEAIQCDPEFLEAESGITPLTIPV